MDNLIFKKIWEDELLYEIRIKAITERITVFTDCYVNDETLVNMRNDIADFIINKQKEKIVAVGTFGDDSVSLIAIKLNQNRSGHILLDIKMELNDDSEPKHFCNFYLRTETGMMERFIDSFKYLCESPVDTEISLLRE